MKVNAAFDYLYNSDYILIVDTKNIYTYYILQNPISLYFTVLGMTTINWLINS